MQIQFHVCDLEQTFTETKEEWAKAYLNHFVSQAKKRADDMIKKFVKPFEKYIAN
jgi:type II restriction enzyme